MKSWFALLLIVFSVVAHADFQVPALTGPVVDDAGVLRPRTVQALERGLRALHERGGAQINVLTVKSLEGTSIEEAGIRTFDKWKLGGEKSDNGVILLIAPKERKLRIEVGQGLEGQLTDADSKRIIAEDITPLFRSGDFDSGVLVGVYKIIAKTDPGFDIKQYLEARAEPQQFGERNGLPRWAVLVGLLILLFLMGRGGGFGSGLLIGSILGSGRSSGTGYNSGGGWGGGGGDWGGGWGGGGGSGSGGGASGDW